MNKKVLIIVVAAIVILIGGGLAVYFLAIKPQQTAASATNSANAASRSNQANLANFKNITGTVLSVSNTDMIVDSGTAQSDVVWDTTTRVTGSSTSDQATVLAVGNTVSVNFTTANNMDQATKITKIDLTALTTSGTPGQAGAGGFGGGSGNFRRGSGSSGSGSSGVVRPTNTPRTSYTGTVTSVSGTTLTLTVSGFGGFTRPGTTGSATPSVTPTPQVLTFDISGATYLVMDTKAVTDVEQGNTVQVTGTLQSNQQVLARSIVIQ